MLHEDVNTSPENEQSVIVYGDMEDEKFFFTGDEGKEALTKAIDYADSIGIPLAENVSVYQVSLYGGRHNVTPKLLNLLIGSVVAEYIILEKQQLFLLQKNLIIPKKCW